MVLMGRQTKMPERLTGMPRNHDNYFVLVQPTIIGKSQASTAQMRVFCEGSNREL